MLCAVASSDAGQQGMVLSFLLFVLLLCCVCCHVLLECVAHVLLGYAAMCYHFVTSLLLPCYFSVTIWYFLLLFGTFCYFLVLSVTSAIFCYFCYLLLHFCYFFYFLVLSVTFLCLFSATFCYLFVTFLSLLHVVSGYYLIQLTQLTWAFCGH